MEVLNLEELFKTRFIGMDFIRWGGLYEKIETNTYDVVYSVLVFRKYNICC